MYNRFLTDIKSMNPNLKVIGFTATPFRLDQGMLTEGKDALFNDIAFDVSILRMISEGYLVPLVPKQTMTEIDISNVHTRGGEFIPEELEAAIDIDEITQSAADEIVAAGVDRGSWLIFCSGVIHAQHVMEAIRSRGVSCEIITGETPSGERDSILRDFKNGNIKCITNMNVLTTGFDAPGVDLIGMLRPTKSQSLYVQMLGRGTRIAAGKEDCLVLDFAGNTKRLGPVDEIHKRVKRPGEPGEGEAPTKTCGVCKMICGTGCTVCPNCGAPFPPPKINVSHRSDTSALLSTQVRDQWANVGGIDYSVHSRPGKTTSMLVTYQTGLMRHREWICFEHTGYPRDKAVSWWRERGGGMPIPSSVAEAMSQVKSLRVPLAIRIKENGKYTDIVGFKWV
jgi:DNA repair protein RadD